MLSIPATSLFFTCLLIFFANIPLGYLRSGIRKLSLKWFLYIYLSVPIVILIRHFFSVQLSWVVAPLLFSSFFLGQFTGKKLRIPCVQSTKQCNFRILNNPTDNSQLPQNFLDKLFYE